MPEAVPPAPVIHWLENGLAVGWAGFQHARRFSAGGLALAEHVVAVVAGSDRLRAGVFKPAPSSPAAARGAAGASQEQDQP